jgi:hypothetical protein
MDGTEAAEAAALAIELLLEGARARAAASSSGSSRWVPRSGSSAVTRSAT